MFIKNNSKNTWKEFNCGGATYITILPEETFEVNDQIGEFLLRVLGAPNWLVKIDAPDKSKVKKAAIKVNEREKEEIKAMAEKKISLKKKK